jgi:hypothetical protein
LPISRAAWSSPCACLGDKPRVLAARAARRRRDLARHGIRRHRQQRTFGDGVDPLGERHQYLFGALKRRLIIGYLDGLARGRQPLDRSCAATTPRGQPLGERPRRIVILAHVFGLVHILSLPAHPRAPADPQIRVSSRPSSRLWFHADLKPQLAGTAAQDRFHLGIALKAFRHARHFLARLLPARHVAGAIKPVAVLGEPCQRSTNRSARKPDRRARAPLGAIASIIGPLRPAAASRSNSGLRFIASVISSRSPRPERSSAWIARSSATF